MKLATNYKYTNISLQDNKQLFTRLLCHSSLTHI